MQKFLFIFLVATLLPACTSYVVPICDESHRRDLPNFEGSFNTLFSFVDKDGTKTVRGQFLISRVARGQYLVESKDGTRLTAVCEIAGRYYTEDNKGWFTDNPTYGYIAFQVTPNGDNSFDLAWLGVDTAVLDAQGILHKQIETPYSKDGDPKGGTYFTMVVDNTNLPSDKFVQLLEPMSMKITLRPGLH